MRRQFFFCYLLLFWTIDIFWRWFIFNDYVKQLLVRRPVFGLCYIPGNRSYYGNDAVRYIVSIGKLRSKVTFSVLYEQQWLQWCGLTFWWYRCTTKQLHIDGCWSAVTMAVVVVVVAATATATVAMAVFCSGSGCGSAIWQKKSFGNFVFYQWSSWKCRIMHVLERFPTPSKSSLSHTHRFR